MRKKKKTTNNPRTIHSDRLWDIRTAAGHLGVSEDSLRARIARRKVPFRRLGGRVVFRPDELTAYVEGLPGLTLEELRAVEFSR